MLASLGTTLSSELLELAFTHGSYSREFGGVPTNERLEHLGDSVLELIITGELYKKFPDVDESRLSKMRAGLVNNPALVPIAKELELGQYLRIGRGEEITGGREKNSILANAFEALVGAIYLEKGYEVTEAIILKWFKPAIESSSALDLGMDAKTVLQELVAAMNLNPPEYELTEFGPDHDKSFKAVVVVSNEKFEVGEGKSKREAEQAAAKFAYDKLSARTS
ncbi:MAG: ribonuclease III [Actinobacteria bacterium]|nr:ribonuclease III [Actinomycetota bacterium]MDA2981652.1 ribonuclease III [Actinomycetota bacterium]MDA2996375.1 ribonuclease III [Actinomycetota bacterium]